MRRGSIVGPVVLIVIGGLFLLNNIRPELSPPGCCGALLAVSSDRLGSSSLRGGSLDLPARRCSGIGSFRR